jgi:hypothetical protein
MKTFHLRTILAFWSFFFLHICFSFGQKDSSSFIASVYFPTVTDTLDISKTGYYLAEVIDDRTNKKNNGYLIQKNIKKYLAFKDSLPSYISSFVFSKTNLTERKAVIMVIEKFRCFSSTDGKIDDGQLYLKAKFLDQNKTMLLAFERTLSYKKKSQANFIAKIVFNATRTAFAGLQKPSSTTSSKAASSLDNKVSYPGNTVKNQLIHSIRIPLEKINWEHTQYYLASVEDHRKDKRNEGSAILGYFNRKAALKTDSSLPYFIQNLCSSRKIEGKKALKMYLNKFKCNEDLTSNGERGTQVFSAQLMLDSLQNTYILYENLILIDTTDTQDITPYWPSIISESLQRYFKAFNTTHSTIFDMEALKADSSEIEVESFHYRNKYFYKQSALKKLRDFENAFAKSPNPEAKVEFKNAQNWIRTGRGGLIIGSALTVYALTDYLSMNDKSFKNWYKANPEMSKKWMIGDKKAFLWSGMGFMAAGFLYNIVGKSALSKAIRLHNKSVYEKMSLNLAPDLLNRGCIFQLNLQLGQNLKEIRHLHPNLSQ